MEQRITIHHSKDMHELNLKLTLEETNVLLDALGSQPFKQVHQLITKIQTQATSQLQDTQQDAQSDNVEDPKAIK